jgi:hypothetical protein
MDVDLNAIIERLMAREKEYISEDRHEYGCAMAAVITPDGIHLDFPRFEDDTSKNDAYQHLVTFAKEHNAQAIITLNNARTRVFKEPVDSDTALSEEMDSSNSKTCLLVTVTGPKLRSYVVQIGYEFAGDNVIFSEPEVSDRLEVNFLPDWSEKILPLID